MKNCIKIALIAATALLLTACTSGTVENKRAPGYIGEKTYEVYVDGYWLNVTSTGWDNCEMGEQYPACLTSSDR